MCVWVWCLSSITDSGRLLHWNGQIWRRKKKPSRRLKSARRKPIPLSKAIRGMIGNIRRKRENVSHGDHCDHLDWLCIVGLLFQVQWYRVILDEAQNIRNRRTSNTCHVSLSYILMTLQEYLVASPILTRPIAGALQGEHLIHQAHYSLIFGQHSHYQRPSWCIRAISLPSLPSLVRLATV